ncbi:MAG: flagellar export protein FliJ [Chloroflexi bacterium]|nr:flagellar export protein FliJ [Chloroflexota bacterium]
MKFNFRLQSVLDYRQSLVDRATGELAHAQIVLSQAEERLSRLRHEERATMARLADQERSVLDLPQLLQLQEHLVVLSSRLVDQATAVAHAKAAADEQQARVLELTKDLKALEKLRDRKSEEWQQESRRLEQMEMNELAARQHRFLRAVS